MALQRWAVVEPILERLRPRRVLEVGCGLGGFGARLAGRYEYVGVEPDATSFATARPRIESAGGRAVHGTVAEIDGPFDLVCAFEVLEHIEDDAGALRQWATCVAPGGHVLLSVPAGTDRYGPSDAHVGHFRRYDPDGLRAVLEDADLEVVEMRRYAWPLGNVTEAVRNRLAARAKGAGRPERVPPPRGSAPRAPGTAGSGRWLQPGPWAGRMVGVAAAPFSRLQHRFPDRGVGLVALARRPDR